MIGDHVAGNGGKAASRCDQNVALFVLRGRVAVAVMFGWKPRIPKVCEVVQGRA